ncbi:ATP-binding SpoIIE family protein phosphatase [Streptomyces aidingensis]|uniref:Serine phosphatase RsbU, regulator of sigma subunit n=1 Tax=Streptomyces aidingensis TaxID=910347 RepID=A0A1I1EYI7_9ACTN|nr:SpoIIE family protein phosphatase [Streptomyces aidingensis]SFB90000.1 Serine phosphatase RsbU, regulator of sigma subunit [Streptomyces aidingensis]
MGHAAEHSGAGRGLPWSAELVLDADGTVLACTATTAELLGRPLPEIRGRPLGGFFRDPSLWERLAANAPDAAQAVLRRPLAGSLDASVSVAPLLTGDGPGPRLLVRLAPASNGEIRDEFGLRVALDSRGTGVMVSDPRVQQRLDLLHAAAVRIGGSLDITESAEELVGMLVPVFADLGAVDLTEEVLAGEEPGEYVTGTPQRRVAVAAARGCWPDDIHQLGETFALGDVESAHMRRGGAGVLPDLGPLRAELGGTPRARLVLTRSATSFLVMPLRARGAVLGALGLWRTGDRTPFDHDDAELTEQIGSRLALGLDNARRYSRERRTAEALQRSLLPRPDVAVTAAETSGVYAPAATAAGTGGSWYDVIPLSSARVAFVVGKVAGHGVHAAGATGRLRSAVQTLADLDPPPDELLSHLNDLVVRFGEDQGQRDPAGAASLLRATCLYAVYDPVGRRCLLASAGHPAPLLARAGEDTAADVVKMHPGPPLGTAGEPFESAELVLAGGDVLAFHSGGPPGRNWDTDRDLGLLGAGAQRAAGAAGAAGSAAAGREPLHTITRDILERLRAEPRRHDLTVLLARVGETPDDATAVWELPADPSRVAEVRSLVSAQLAAWDLTELLFATELIVSELVTNAIRYAGGPVGIRLIRDQRLICEVSDPSQTQPHLRRARLSDEGGRGLFLVAQVAHRWGSRYTPTGKTIWTEQEMPPR